MLSLKYTNIVNVVDVIGHRSDMALTELDWWSNWWRALFI